MAGTKADKSISLSHKDGIKQVKEQYPTCTFVACNITDALKYMFRRCNETCFEKEVHKLDLAPVFFSIIACSMKEFALVESHPSLISISFAKAHLT